MSDPLITGIQARTIILNVHALVRGNYKSCPLWVLVRDITGHGSGVCIEICKSTGLDPHEEITNKMPTMIDIVKGDKS